MIIETYDPANGNPITQNPSISLTDIIQSQHACPVVFRCLKDTENELTSVQITLSDGGFAGNSYGLYTSPNFIPHISSGTYTFSDLVLSTPQSIPISDSSGEASDYAWIDVRASSQATGPSLANFSLNYDFS